MSGEEAETTLADQLTELLNLLEAEDYAEAATLCPRLVDAVEKEELLPSLHEIWFQSLLQQGNYEAIVELVDKKTVSVSAEKTPRLYDLYLYALYRLQRYEETLKLTADKEEPFQRHLQSQSLYHLSATKDCLEAYRNLLEQETNDDDRIEALTNLSAAILANALVYVRSNENDDFAQLWQQDLEKDPFPYDLAYNVASWNLLTENGGSSLELLKAAQQACLAQDDNDAAIASNLQWSRSLWSGRVVTPQASENATAAVQTVQSVNQALASDSTKQGLETLLSTSTDKMSPLQQRLLWCNRAVLQFRCEQYNDCQATCQSLSDSLWPSKRKQKAKSAVLPPCATELDAAWWQGRVAVLQAQCYQRQDKRDQAADSLKTAVTKLQALPASTVRDHALCHVLLHQKAIQQEEPMTADETIQFLKQDLPESIQSSPAVTATLASIYHRQGEEQEAQKLLLQSGNDAILADFFLSQGKYDQAAALYEKSAQESADDPAATARWVYALSHVDPERARQLWSTSSLPELVAESDSNEVDGAELEQRELPLFKMQRKASDLAASTLKQEPEKKKKSHEAVLRRRARKREEYISKLEEKGLYRADRPTKPDPERWLPKYERAHSRRRRNRGGPHKGAQGGVSQKDAAKLDVAARQAAEPEAGGRSTAHVSVSSGGRKGGRRR